MKQRPSQHYNYGNSGGSGGHVKEVPRYQTDQLWLHKRKNDSVAPSDKYGCRGYNRSMI